MISLRQVLWHSTDKRRSTSQRTLYIPRCPYDILQTKTKYFAKDIIHHTMSLWHPTDKRRGTSPRTVYILWCPYDILQTKDEVLCKGHYTSYDVLITSYKQMGITFKFNICVCIILPASGQAIFCEGLIKSYYIVLYCTSSRNPTISCEQVVWHSIGKMEGTSLMPSYDVQGQVLWQSTRKWEVLSWRTLSDVLQTGRSG